MNEISVPNAMLHYKHSSQRIKKGDRQSSTMHDRSMTTMSNAPRRLQIPASMVVPAKRSKTMPQLGANRSTGDSPKRVAGFSKLTKSLKHRSTTAAKAIRARADSGGRSKKKKKKLNKTSKQKYY